MLKDDRHKGCKADNNKKLLIRFTCKSCAPPHLMRLLFTSLVLLCFLLAIILFTTTTTTTSAVSPTTTTTISPPLPPPPTTVFLQNGVIKRSFNPYGTAAYNFILMSAYRGGTTSFAVIGLSSKPLHVFSRPTYTCEYITNTTSTTTRGHKILPDWGFGRVYTTVVINCTFPTTSAAADPTTGGRLLIHAATNGGFDRNLINLTDTIETLVESPNTWNHSYFNKSPPKYDYLYCGSSLYGNLSPQRIREWISYHVRLFGNRSHFVIHDAGGVHHEVMEVLKPWIELGFVTVEDIKDQERFDSYYHNQFLIVNDCLHRYRFDAKWMFFFDVDEFIHIVNPKKSITYVMDSLKEYTQITIDQLPMSNKLCLGDDAGKWGLEKLVYRDVKRVTRRDRKYAIQPRNVLATGVHLSNHLQGNITGRTEKLLTYFHYHGTIATRRETCRWLINKTSTVLEGNPYVLDTTLRSMAPFVKRFELNTIGNRLQSTRQ